MVRNNTHTLTMEQAKKELEGIENVMLFEKEGDMIDTSS